MKTSYPSGLDQARERSTIRSRDVFLGQSKDLPEIRRHRSQLVGVAQIDQRLEVLVLDAAGHLDHLDGRFAAIGSGSRVRSRRSEHLPELGGTRREDDLVALDRRFLFGKVERDVREIASHERVLQIRGERRLCLWNASVYDFQLPKQLCFQNNICGWQLTSFHDAHVLVRQLVETATDAENVGPDQSQRVPAEVLQVPLALRRTPAPRHLGLHRTPRVVVGVQQLQIVQARLEHPSGQVIQRASDQHPGVSAARRHLAFDRLQVEPAGARVVHVQRVDRGVAHPAKDVELRPDLVRGVPSPRDRQISRRSHFAPLKSHYNPKQGVSPIQVVGEIKGCLLVSSEYISAR